MSARNSSRDRNDKGSEAASGKGNSEEKKETNKTKK
jgi:hypothetical protein